MHTVQMNPPNRLGCTKKTRAQLRYILVALESHPYLTVVVYFLDSDGNARGNEKNRPTESCTQNPASSEDIDRGLHVDEVHDVHWPTIVENRQSTSTSKREASSQPASTTKQPAETTHMHLEEQNIVGVA